MATLALEFNQLTIAIGYENGIINKKAPISAVLKKAKSVAIILNTDYTFMKRGENAIIILGMHRSGTSLLAGTLEEAGLYLGDIDTSNPYNKKGNRESRFINTTHERLLKRNGGSWDNPPNKVKWHWYDEKVRELFIDQMSKVKPWGFKDPRTIFLIDGWKKDLPDSRLVGIFRDPSLTIQSLMHRNKFTQNKAEDLWFSYNCRLLEIKEEYGLSLIEYSIDAQKTKLSLLALIHVLELRPPEELLFYDKLLAKRRSEIELNEKVNRLYLQLKEHALQINLGING